MTERPPTIDNAQVPGELPEHLREDQARFQRLSLAERGQLLSAVCAAAMDILAARRKMGIPDPEPDPWPASTIEFMRKHAPNGRKGTDS